MAGPSWSWASLDFDYADIDFLHPANIQDTLVNVVEARVESASGNIYGHLSGGYIKLEGRIDQVFHATFPAAGQRLKNDYTGKGQRLKNPYSYKFSLDAEVSYTTDENLYCVPIAIYEQAPGYCYPLLTTCLLLRPKIHEAQEFLRVGTLSVSLDTDVILPKELQWIVDFSRADSARRQGLSTIMIY